MIRSGVLTGVALLAAWWVMGCATAHYVTPGGGVNLESIDDYDIQERFAAQPAALFPAHLAVVRVQQSGYVSHGNEGYGEGRFSVVTKRDVEGESAFESIAGLPQVGGVATLNRLVIPRELQTVTQLRRAAATLQADMLLVYTLDTSFRVQNRRYGPLSTITLGVLPNKDAVVTTTASAALFDVRTGYLYGLAEASERATQLASVWTRERVVDDARLQTEAAAFDGLVHEFGQLWRGIVERHAKSSARVPLTPPQARSSGCEATLAWGRGAGLFETVG